jgi:hypothetical protein
MHLELIPTKSVKKDIRVKTRPKTSLATVYKIGEHVEMQSGSDTEVISEDQESNQDLLGSIQIADIGEG